MIKNKIDLTINNDNLKAIATPVSMIFGGGLGGIGNYHLERIGNVEATPAPIFPYVYLGALSGSIGAAVILWRLKKDFLAYQIALLAIAAGLCFPNILSGVKSFFSLKSQIVQLERDVAQEQEKGISALVQIASETQDENVQQEAVKEITAIAKRTQDEQVLDSAIAAVQNDNSDLLQTIANLEQLAINSSTTGGKETIRNTILQFREGYGAEVSQRAIAALALLAEEDETPAELEPPIYD